MFAWRVDRDPRELARHLPGGGRSALETALARRARGLARAYRRLPVRSRSTRRAWSARSDVAVVRARFPWSDVGSWAAVGRLWRGRQRRRTRPRARRCRRQPRLRRRQPGRGSWRSSASRTSWSSTRPTPCSSAGRIAPRTCGWWSRSCAGAGSGGTSDGGARRLRARRRRRRSPARRASVPRAGARRMLDALRARSARFLVALLFRARARAARGRRARPPARRSRAPSSTSCATGRPIDYLLVNAVLLREGLPLARFAPGVSTVLVAARAASWLRWFVRRRRAPRAAGHAACAAARRRRASRCCSSCAASAVAGRRRRALAAARLGPQYLRDVRARRAGERRVRCSLVPVAIFRGPGFRRKESRLATLLYSVQEAPGEAKRLFTYLWNAERDAADARPRDRARALRRGVPARGRGADRAPPGARAADLPLSRGASRAGARRSLPRRMVREQVLRDPELARLVATRRRRARRAAASRCGRRRAATSTRWPPTSTASTSASSSSSSTASGRASSRASRSSGSSGSIECMKRAPGRARAVPPQPLRLPDPLLHLPPELPLAAAHRRRHQPVLLADRPALPRRRRVLHPPHASRTTSSTRWSSGSTSRSSSARATRRSSSSRAGAPAPARSSRRSSACCRRS